MSVAITADMLVELMNKLHTETAKQSYEQM